METESTDGTAPMWILETRETCHRSRSQTFLSVWSSWNKTTNSKITNSKSCYSKSPSALSSLLWDKASISVLLLELCRQGVAWWVTFNFRDEKNLSQECHIPPRLNFPLQSSCVLKAMECAFSKEGQGIVAATERVPAGLM